MKRPALRGVVTRAGVTCDARPLSCCKIEPSALPLPWVFCRSRMRQNRAQSGPESAAGRLGGLPSLPVSISVLLSKIARPKIFPATIAYKGRNTAFRCLGGVRMPPSSQAGHKPPHDAKQAASRFQAVTQNELYGYWQRKTCQKIIDCILFLRNILRTLVLWTESSSLITAR